MSRPAWTPAAASEMAGLLHRARHGVRRLGASRGSRLWALYQDAVLHLAGQDRWRADRPVAATGLVLRAVGLFYRPRGVSLRSGWEAMARGIPRTVRAEGRWVLTAAAWYAAVGLAAALAAGHSRAWADLLLQGVVPRAGGRAGMPPGPGLVAMLFFHNVLASAAAYAGGVAAGVGAVAALAFNASLVGAILGVVGAQGPLVGTASLLAPHAVLELPATFCAGGGGLAMGFAWLSPGERSRTEALADAFRRTVPLFGACIVWLAAAALVEGLFTPLPIAAGAKLAVAGVLAVLFVLYLVLPRSGMAAPQPPPGAGAGRAPGPVRLQAVARRAFHEPGRRSPRRAASAATVSVRLPEGVQLTLAAAGVPSRAVALLLDTLILSAGFGALILGLMAAFGGLPPVWEAAAGAAYLAGFYGLYGFLCEWLGGGATPGKRALGLAVLRADGRPLDVSAALIRNVLRIVDFLPALYATGLVAALTSGGSKRLGDWAAGTVVVHLPPAAASPARRTGAPLPLPRVRACGPLPERAALQRIPAPWREGLAGCWRRDGGASPEAHRLLEAATRAAGLPLAAAPGAAAIEHFVAATDRAGLLGEARWRSAEPRDRREDLAPRAPSPAAMDRVPPSLAAAVSDYWARLPALDARRRGPLAAVLAARLAQALGAPGLDQPDPDALVEHVAHLLRQR